MTPMNRLFLIAWSAVVIVVIALMVLLYVSLLPHFGEIGDTMIWLLRLAIACAAVLLVTGTYSLVGRLISKRRRDQLHERVIIAGEVSVYVMPTGELVPISAIHEQAKIPRMLPAPKDEVIPSDDDTVIELYSKGLTYQTIMDSTGLKYNKVQRIVSDAKQKGLIA